MSEKKLVLMQGNEACLEGAIAAGMRFFGGYPITPSTEIAEYAALRLPKVGGCFIQMEDEIAGMAAVIGASVAGLKSLTATSGPGFSLKQENIGYAALAEIPCVIVNVQRSGPSTGIPTAPSQGDVMQARWGTHGDHPVIAISPSSVAEAYELVIRCFNLSEKYRTPVIFLMDEVVGHMREGIYIPDASEIQTIDRARPDPNDKDWKPYRVSHDADIPVIPPFGEGWRYHITGLAHDENGYPTSDREIAHALFSRVMRKIEQNADDIITYEEYEMQDAEVAVLCYGCTARSARKAVKSARKQGIKAGMFRPITIWPFPEKQVKELAKKVKHIVVAEHNYGQIVYEVERIAKNDCSVSHLGKIDGNVITPAEIVDSVKDALARV